MDIDVDNLTREQASQFYPSLITPRPVVIIGTARPDSDAINLAPYSSISFIANNPPMLAISFSQRHHKPKDTLTNALAAGQLVVNMVNRELAAKLGDAAATPRPEDSKDDYSRLGLSRADMVGYKPGRISNAPAALGCDVVTTYDLLPSSCTLMTVVVKKIYLDSVNTTSKNAEASLPDRLWLDVLSADLVASVGGETYVSLRALSNDRISLPRTWD